MYLMLKMCYNKNSTKEPLMANLELKNNSI